jgi:RNA polymerase sigma-70 factor (ECF subfamily)
MTLNDKVVGYFQQFQRPVFQYLLRRTHDAGQAEDLTQETFLRLCRHLQKERSLENPKAWLFTVAGNLVIDLHRKECNITDVNEFIWEEVGNSRSTVQSDPETLLLQNERLDRLRTAVLNLTPLQHECVHLRAEGLRYQEIAEMMAINISTVASAVRRATVKLAREVDSTVSPIDHVGEPCKCKLRTKART